MKTRSPTEGYWLLAMESSDISYGLVIVRICDVLVYRSRLRHLARRF